MDYMDPPSSRFETSEMLATFLGSTPLLTVAWRLCSLANTMAPRSFLSERIGDVGFVAFSGVQVVDGSDPSAETLVPLDLEGGRWKELFRPLIYPCEDEKPVMVHKGFLQLFLEAHSSHHFQDQINALRNCQSIVVTGHSIGATTASFTALWLLSHLLSIKSTISILCITFGSPLIGNDSLNQAILHGRWSGSFLHIVAKHDILPRLFLLSTTCNSHPLNSLQELWQCYIDSPLCSGLLNDEGIARLFESISTLSKQIGQHETYWPFGSYLLCSDDGAICVDNATSIVKLMDLMQMESSSNFGIEDHLKYGDYVSKVSFQFIKIERFTGGDHLPESSYEASASLALQSSGINIKDWTSAKEWLNLSRRMGCAPSINSVYFGIKLSKITPYSAEIEWYKKRCDESLEEKGYYDTFRSNFFSRRETKVNNNRYLVGKFWDDCINKIERNELPHIMQWQPKWVYASRIYTLLFEPLEIAAYYRFDMYHKKGHYRSHGRERRFEILNKWWKQRGLGKDKPRSKLASLTQDSCFWAKVEEAKEWLSDAKSAYTSNSNKLPLLVEKLNEFEKYADGLIKEMEVSKDVFAKNSSYSLWVKEWCGFKH